MKKMLSAIALALFAASAAAQSLPSPSFNNVTIQGNLNLPSKPANTIMAAPSGAAGVPTFRTLTDVDIPALTVAKITGLQGFLDAKAPLASPAFTGVPTAPTAVAGTNTTQLATTAFVLANGGSPSNMVTTDTTQTITGTKTFSNLPTFNAGILPVVRGGTGVATSTGSGAVVLGTSPTISNLTLAGNGLLGNLPSNGYAVTGTGITSHNVNGSVQAMQSLALNGVETLRLESNSALGANIVTSTSNTWPLTFNVNGSERMRISASGAVSTTTTPARGNNSTTVATTAFVALNKDGINPRDYGAACDAVNGAYAALNSAASAAASASLPLVINCPIVVESPITINSAVQFSGAGKLISAFSSAIVLNGSVTGDSLKSTYFGGDLVFTLGSPGRVSACWWGACDGSADVAPQLRKMFTSGMSGKEIIFPGGNYNVCSAIPVGTGAGTVGYPAFNQANVVIKGLTGFKVDAESFGLANFITACTASAQNQYFLIDSNTDWEWKGGNFIGLRTGLATTTVNTPWGIINNQRFKIHKARASSGYHDAGAFFEGDFNTDFVIEDNIGVAGQGIDMAFSCHGVYRNNRFTGTSSDAANIGIKGFSHIYDGPLLGYGTTSCLNSFNVKLDGNTFDNYVSGIVLQNGTKWKIVNNSLENIKGGGSSPASGVLINYNPSGAFANVGHVPGDIVIGNNTIDGLGATVAGCFVNIGANAIANSDVFNNILVDGNSIAGGSGSSAVCSDTNSGAKVANLFVGINSYRNIGAVLNTNAAALAKPASLPR